MRNSNKIFTVRITLAWWLRWAKYPWVIYRVVKMGRACTSAEIAAFVASAIKVKVVPAKWVLKA